MAEPRELRTKPGVFYKFASEGEDSRTLICFSAIYVADGEYAPYVVVQTNHGPPRNYSIEGEPTETDKDFSFTSLGAKYVISDFTNLDSERLFGGIPLTAELMEQMVVNGYEFKVFAEEGKAAGVYLVIPGGDVYLREGATWVKSSADAVPEEAVSVGLDNANYTTRAATVGDNVDFPRQ